MSNANVANTNFTATAILYNIAGTVSGAISAGVEITLDGPSVGSMITDVNGDFSFTGFQNGTYTVVPSSIGLTFNPTSLVVNVNNGNVTGVNFTATAITYSISGAVTGAPNVTVTLTGPTNGSATTDANGGYSFSGLTNGPYTVTPTSLGNTFAPTSLAVTVSNENVANINFTATATVVPTYTVSGNITGASNVTVTLTGTANASAITDANGNFSFANLQNGSFTITPTAPGYTFSPTSTAVTVSNENVANINFTATATVVPTYTVSGNITGASNVTVTLTGPTSGTTTPDANGNFSFAGLQNGTHTITPSGAGYAFSPVDAVAIVSDADIANLNFVVPMLATGKLLYPCPQAICSKDLATGVETVLWGAYGAYPSKIVPVRNGQSVAFQEGNGIYLLSLATLTAQQVVWGGIDWTPGCSSEAQGRFDLSQSGDAVVFSSECTPIGTPAKRDIVLMKTDGTMFWSRVTDDNASESSPIIGSAGGVNDHLASYFVSNKNGGYDIWKQVVDLVNGVLVGDQTLFVSDVVKDETFFGLSVYNKSCISINAEYGQMAYMRRVDGMIHIITKPLDGGVEVDLGPGESPYWATSGEILYYASGYLWVVNPDGTGRKQVPLPSNLLYDLSRSRVRALSSIVLVP